MRSYDLFRELSGEVQKIIESKDLSPFEKWERMSEPDREIFCKATLMLCNELTALAEKLKQEAEETQ